MPSILEEQCDILLKIIEDSMAHLSPEEQKKKWDKLEKYIKDYQDSIAGSSSPV